MSVYQDQETETWRYDFQLSNRRYTGRGYSSQRKAKDAESDRRRELKAGSSEAFSSFGDLIAAWLEAGATTKSAHHVYQQMKQVEKAYGHLEKMRLRDITRAHLEPPLHKVRRRCKASTANAYRRDILAAFNWAEKLGAIVINPARNLPIFPEDEPSRQPVPTVDLKKLILAAEQPLAARLIFISQTACRWVECARLRWSEVHLGTERPFALLTSRKRRGGHAKKRPQPLTDTAVEVVEGMRGQSKEFVFPNSEGGMSKYTTDKAQLRTLCRKLKLPSYGFHQVRHWAGLVAAQSAANPKAIADLLGHSSTAATQRYMHWSAPEMWALAERLERELDLSMEQNGGAVGVIPMGSERKRAVLNGA